jgi:hypothetical protein
MYWLILDLLTGAARIVYAAAAPETTDDEACDGYDTERDAVQALREWREENDDA